MLVLDRRIVSGFDQLSCSSSVSTTDRFLRDLIVQSGDLGLPRHTVIDCGVVSTVKLVGQVQFQQIVMVMNTYDSRVR